MRDPTDLLRLAIFLGAFAQLPRENWSGALRLALTFLVCCVPRMLEVPKVFDFSFVFAMSLQGWGNIAGAFDAWLPYHDLVHCVLTLATAALFYFVLVRLRLVPDPTEQTSLDKQLGVAVLVFAIGTAIGAIYEEYEWFAITYVHAHLTEYYTHDVADLAFNELGSIAAAVLLVVWSRRRWTTRRQSGGEDPLAGLLRGLERRMARSAEAPAGPRPDGAAGLRLHLDRGEHPPPAPGLPGPLRLLAGDWTPPVRDLADLLRISFLAGAVLALLAGEAATAVRFGLTFAAALGARWVDPPRLFDLAFNLALGFEAWGAWLGGSAALQSWTYFVVAMASAVMLYLALLRLRLFPELADDPRLHRRVAIALAATALGYSVGVVYALYIYFADTVLGAGFRTSWDILTAHLALDFAGALAGAAVLLAWDVYGWGNRRRLRASQLG